MFKVIGGVRGVSHVQGDGRVWRASAMPKVMGGGEGRQPCWKWWEGWVASAIFKVMERVRGVTHVQDAGRGVMGVTHVQGNGRGVRGVSHGQGDGRVRKASAMFKVMGGGEGRQPCSRWWKGFESHVQVERGGGVSINRTSTDYESSRPTVGVFPFRL